MKSLSKQFVWGRWLMVAAAVCFVLLQSLVVWAGLAFLFEGNWGQHQLWFKHVYVFTYFFFNTVYPLLYALWFWGLAQAVHLRGKIGVLVLQTVLVTALQQYAGYAGVSAYGVLLLLLTLLLWVKPYAVRLGAFGFLTKAATGSFLFGGYVVLCLALPQFHPFAKYTMFNRFPQSTRVYLLRNQNNELVPIEQYSRLKNDDLFAYSEAIKQQAASAQPLPATMPIPPAVLGNRLMQLFINNLRPNHPPFQKLTLYQITFTLQQGRPVQTQTPLCEYVAP